MNLHDNTSTPSSTFHVNGAVTIEGTLNGCTLPTGGDPCSWGSTSRTLSETEDSAAFKAALKRIEALEARESLLMAALQRIESLEVEIASLKQEET